jgi:hypothetical protein
MGVLPKAIFLYFAARLVILKDEPIDCFQPRQNSQPSCFLPLSTHLFLSLT